PRSAGIFLGGTIHNVPQAVAAGYVISHQAGDMATLTKLLRVTTLLPAVIGVAWLCDRQTTSEARSHAGLPLFLIGFFGVVVINSLGWLPGSIVTTLSGAAEWALIVALTALSARTTFSGMIAEGWRPLAVIVGDTVFLAGLVLAGLWIA
ncbi:MAG: putative sulfate exporter family transporter, partial [Gammaproteobacteria bacterium]